MDQQQKIKVLLADDHVIVRAGFRKFLDVSGDIQVVAEAGDGEEATRLIEKYKPDVAVLDIQMPKMTGIEVTRWVRSHGLKTGLLILTAYDDDPYIRAVLQAGANGYILKTANPRDIIQAVRDVHQGKSAVDAAIAQKLLLHLMHREDFMPVDPLTERENEALTLAGKGLTNKAISLQMGISDRTVQNHLARVFEKLNARSRTEAVMRAVSLGIIPANLVEKETGS